MRKFAPRCSTQFTVALIPGPACKASGRIPIVTGREIRKPVSYRPPSKVKNPS